MTAHNPYLNATHATDLRSWVTDANLLDSDFPIQNLPFASFRRQGTQEAFRMGVAIGSSIVDLTQAVQMGVFSAFDEKTQVAAKSCVQSNLNGLLVLDSSYWSALRQALSKVLSFNAKEKSILENCLLDQSGAEYDIAVKIGSYTDFYTSIHHATSVGKLFRPDNPLLPNYKHVPIGYHGRASSIIPSGKCFHRPVAQIMKTGASQPILTPSERLDYELELGLFVGQGNALGQRITLKDAAHHAFGVCLLNDWSARDVQAWEYQPLGPFLSKNFASTLSPWVLTLEALAPYRCPWQRPASDGAPLAYLDSANERAFGAFDIVLQVFLQSRAMREQGLAPMPLASSNFKHAYWTLGHMLTHHSVGGCNLQAGDLLGTGTQSGPNPGEEGSLLEQTQGGKTPIALPSGETRTFLADGDMVILSAHCQKEGAARLGFGCAIGTVLPALPLQT